MEKLPQDSNMEMKRTAPTITFEKSGARDVSGWLRDFTASEEMPQTEEGMDEYLEKLSDAAQAAMSDQIGIAEEKVRTETLEGLKALQEANRLGPEWFNRIAQKVVGHHESSPEVRESIINGSVSEMIDTLSQNPDAIKDSYVRSRLSIMIKDSLLPMSGNLETALSLTRATNFNAWPNDFLKKRVTDYLRYAAAGLEAQGKTEQLQELKDLIK